MFEERLMNVRGAVVKSICGTQSKCSTQSSCVTHSNCSEQSSCVTHSSCGTQSRCGTQCNGWETLSNTICFQPAYRREYFANREISRLLSTKFNLKLNMTPFN